jgi:hypothetical protein
VSEWYKKCRKGIEEKVEKKKKEKKFVSNKENGREKQNESRN